MGEAGGAEEGEVEEMSEQELRAALTEPIKSEPPWCPPGWRNTLIINKWEADVIIERLRNKLERESLSQGK